MSMLSETGSRFCPEGVYFRVCLSVRLSVCHAFFTLSRVSTRAALAATSFLLSCIHVIVVDGCASSLFLKDDF